MIVVTVLKSGGDYDVEDVNRLYESMEQDLIDYDITFMCFTDYTDFEPIDKFHIGIDVMLLLADLPGWWSKMEIFRLSHWLAHDLLYIDLDTVPIRSMKPVFDVCEGRKDMIMLSDFYFPHKYASAIMYIPYNVPGNFELDFFRYPKGVMEKYRGDQDFLQAVIEREDIKVDRWDKVLPNAFCSYKAHFRPDLMPGSANPLPVDLSQARVVCFHGKPRPKDVDINTEVMNKLR